MRLAVVSGRDLKMLNGTSGCDATFASQKIKAAKSASPKKNLYTVSLYMDDARYDKKNRSVNEPIYFFIRGTRAPMEFTVNQIGKDKIAGYLSVPKTNPVHAQISP